MGGYPLNSSCTNSKDFDFYDARPAGCLGNDGRDGIRVNMSKSQSIPSNLLFIILQSDHKREV